MTLQLQRTTIGDLEWLIRPDSSDIKSINEVVAKHSYEKQGITLQANEKWIDLGANIGAFTVLAASKGCHVTAYEPDPVSCRITEENLKINNLEAEVINAAITTTNTSKANFYQNTARRNYWRNSLVKQWRGGKSIKVQTLNFKEHLYTGANIKMDIEGSEFAILENLDYQQVGNLVFEWSFDIDPSIRRFTNVITELRKHYTKVSYAKFDENYDMWQASWFPPCKTVYCIK
jgi:FkbM family methyltransferase